MRGWYRAVRGVSVEWAARRACPTRSISPRETLRRSSPAERRPARRAPGGWRSAGRGRLEVPDQLLVEQRAALALSDGDDLVALGEDRLGAERGGDPVSDHGEQRAALG